MNLSGAQLAGDGLAPLVQQSLADCGLPPWRLVLEININLWWGVVMLAFGACMLFFAARGRTAVCRSPAPSARRDRRTATSSAGLPTGPVSYADLAAADAKMNPPAPVAKKKVMKHKAKAKAAAPAADAPAAK